MLYIAIHVFIHSLLYVFWRFLLPKQLIRFFTLDNKLSAKGHIKLAFWMAAVPFTVAAFINMLLQVKPPFELAPFLVTLSYLLHVKAFIGFMQQQGVEVQNYFKDKDKTDH